MNINQKEHIQLNKAGNAAGAYLDKLTKYDLRTLTKQEWEEFIKTICVEYYLPF